MAWPSGWKQHLLVPQQSAWNAKGDKSGHLFITWCAAPKCHKSPWLFVCCEPADKKCILSEQELPNFLVQCEEDINRSSKNHENCHLKISLLWGWTFTISQISSKCPEGRVVTLWIEGWFGNYTVRWECNIFARLFIALISLFFPIFLVEFDLETDINRISVILAECWSIYSSAHNGVLWNIYQFCFHQSKLQAYLTSVERCKKSLLQKPNSVCPNGVSAGRV